MLNIWKDMSPGCQYPGPVWEADDQVMACWLLDTKQFITWNNANVLSVGPWGQFQWNLDENTTVYFLENVPSSL